MKIEAGDNILLLSTDEFYEKYVNEKDFFMVIR
jgi:hypothetical protein